MLTLFTQSGKQYFIDESKEIQRGGEGMIVPIDDKMVAKIYLPGNHPLTKEKYDFLKNLDQTFVKPIDILYKIKKNRQKELVGFTMEYLHGDYNPLYAYFKTNFCNRNGIDDQWKIKICKDLSNAVKRAHNLNVVIGDLTGLNAFAELSGELKMIDVDSYETPGCKHSGKLLEDIRDYLHGGEINQNSDFFALAITTFNLLTGIHPFKGVHLKYDGLYERMIHKISVLSGDRDLIIPKCYNELSNKALIEQYHKIFNDGDRFLINFDDNIQVITIKTTSQLPTFTDNLIISSILNSDKIKYVTASNNRLAIIDGDLIRIYKTEVKHHFIEKYKINNKGYVPILTDKYAYLLANGKLFNVDKNIEIKGLSLGTKYRFQQYDNILVVITADDKMHKIFLDSLIEDTLRVETTAIYEKSIQKINGIHQNMDGHSYVFYNQKNINTIECNEQIKDIYQKNDVGIIEVMVNNKLEYHLFRIEGLDMKNSLYDVGVKSLAHFGYNVGNYLIVPEDGALKFLRYADFYPMAKFDCDAIREDSEVYYTQAGIIVNNGDKVFMINKK